MFWQSLQVTFEIFCSHVAQVGTGVFLDQTRQINGHFEYILTELIEQKDHSNLHTTLTDPQICHLYCTSHCPFPPGQNEHLQYVRMLFIDYSSAFNTIAPTKLINKLRTLGLNTSLCNWILDFLTGHL